MRVSLEGDGPVTVFLDSRKHDTDAESNTCTSGALPVLPPSEPAVFHHSSRHLRRRFLLAPSSSLNGTSSSLNGTPFGAFFLYSEEF